MRSPRSAAGIRSGDEGRRGSVAVLVGLMLVVIIGFVALGTEAVLLLLTARHMQSAADAAALASVTARLSGHPADYTQEAFALTAAAGFTNGQNGTTVAVHSPPATGSYTSAADAVEVLIAQPQTLALAKAVYAGPITVRARAVARLDGGGTVCVLGLDTAAANTVLVDNNGTLANPNCAIGSNSTSASALNCNNNCTIAGPTTVVGDHAVSNNGYLNGSPNLTHAAPSSDPYAGVAAGSAGACTRTTTVTSGSITPGHYCGGVMVSGSTLTMSSGVYYIDQKFGIQNGATLNANPSGGVTIVINGTYCIGSGDCEEGHGIGGNGATLNITAQQTGAFAGIAIVGPRNSTSSVKQEFSGTSHNNIQGAIYFPAQTILFDNNSQLNSSVCTQIIGDKIHISNNANVSTNCSGTGVTPIIFGGSQTKLTE